MDDFPLDWPELHGGPLHLEFTDAGRIQQLWVLDAETPDGEEVEFVAPRIAMGEEASEDFFPGTVLLSARTDPDDPWIGSRNVGAERSEDEDGIVFEYEFPFLEDLRAVGRYVYESDPVPHVRWDLTLRNRSRHSVEIGELGFPFAFNNVLEVNGRDDRAVADLFEHRLHLHLSVGRAASYLHAARVSGDDVGLVVLPGEETEWEFANHVPASLRSPFRWTGIPIVYVYSRATVEREEWSEWFHGHRALVLEPGDQRIFQTLFAPVGRPAEEELGRTLAILGKPGVRLFPGAVSPVNVAVGVEIAGPTPTVFSTSGDADLETDADENGGFALVRPETTGPLDVSWEDVRGQTSEIHLLFTDPIPDLLDKRAQWIVERQRVETGPHLGAIVGCDNRGEPESNEWLLSQSWGVEFGLSDALFLAVKNLRRPNPYELGALADYVNWVRRTLVHPVTGEVGTEVSEGNPRAVRRFRPVAQALLHALFDRLGRLSNADLLPEAGYAETAERLRDALLRDPDAGEWLATGHWSQLFLDSAKLPPLAPLREWAAAPLASRVARAYAAGQGRRAARGRRRLLAGRSLAPQWWSFGSDLRFLAPRSPHPALSDTAIISHGPTAPAALAAFAASFRVGAGGETANALRAVVGGYLAPYAYVRPDGAASMGFTPDPASGHYGMSDTGGDLGAALVLSLEAGLTGGYLLEDGSSFTLGCHVEGENEPITRYRLATYDVPARVRLPAFGFWAEVSVGYLEQVVVDADLRRVELILGESDVPHQVTVTVAGLWGRAARLDGERQELAPDGSATWTVRREPDRSRKITVHADD